MEFTKPVLAYAEIWPLIAVLGVACLGVLAEALLYARNDRWAEWIDTRMDSPGTVFVAVGAGHLAGAKSVQDYLTARGFTVDRVQ